MILCVGTYGSGKSVLLGQLQEFNIQAATNESFKKASAALETVEENEQLHKRKKTAVPTVGTNLITLTKPRAKKSSSNVPEEIVVIREVGGSMAPLWHSYIEPGKTRGVLYVVDSSSPETIAPATIFLLELLQQPGLDSAKVKIVFSKTDLQGALSLNEIKAIMRLEDILKSSKQEISTSSFNANETKHLQELLDWCYQFSVPRAKEKKI